MLACYSKRAFEFRAETGTSRATAIPNRTRHIRTSSMISSPARPARQRAILGCRPMGKSCIFFNSPLYGLAVTTKRCRVKRSRRSGGMVTWQRRRGERKKCEDCFYRAAFFLLGLVLTLEWNVIRFLASFSFLPWLSFGLRSYEFMVSTYIRSYQDN
jgi:hypothetical protein